MTEPSRAAKIQTVEDEMDMRVTIDGSEEKEMAKTEREYQGRKQSGRKEERFPRIR